MAPSARCQTERSNIHERAAVLSYIGRSTLTLILDMERIEARGGVRLRRQIRPLGGRLSMRNWRYCDDGMRGMPCSGPGAVHKRRKRPWQVGSS